LPMMLATVTEPASIYARVPALLCGFMTCCGLFFDTRPIALTASMLGIWHYEKTEWEGALLTV
jgi:hypothetical protein